MLVYAVVFAVAMMLATSYFLPGIQANGVAAAMHNAWGTDVRISAVVLGILLAVIIMGGVRRIANFASLVVPLMAVVYILASIVIMFVNFDRIDDVFSLIFRSAFDQEAMFSGMLGAAIMWGVKRGIYSNEAGQGTGPQSRRRRGVAPGKTRVRAGVCRVRGYVVCVLGDRVYHHFHRHV